MNVGKEKKEKKEEEATNISSIEPANRNHISPEKSEFNFDMSSSRTIAFYSKLFSSIVKLASHCFYFCLFFLFESTAELHAPKNTLV
ncbi:hypothetical protein BLOT_004390 [Blomia tropicalis]|nr:hypothetical protein BLOT_004390 [Blomia tropicalis]